MRGLLGDRFLRKFGGDLKYWRKNQDATGEGKNPEAEVNETSGNEAARVDSHVCEEDRKEADADTAVTDTDDAPIKSEPNTQNEIEP